jgi:hypothetical protein
MGHSFSPLIAGLFTEDTKVRVSIVSFWILTNRQKTWRSTQYCQLLLGKQRRRNLGTF